MLGDSWADELRADRVPQVVDYLRNELQALRSHPSNYYSLGAVYMWSGVLENLRGFLNLYDSNVEFSAAVIYLVNQIVETREATE
jgi:hypothetical protein